MNTIKSNVVCKRFDHIDLINYILNLYKIDGITLNIFEGDKMLNMFSNDELEMSAILTNMIPNIYALYVREGSLSPDIICHEMIHLWQYHRGDLKMLNNGRQYLWKGRIYDSSTAYTDREWEIEAFGGMNKLLRKYKKQKRAERK